MITEARSDQQMLSTCIVMGSHNIFSSTVPPYGDFRVAREVSTVDSSLVMGIEQSSVACGACAKAIASAAPCT